MKKECPINSVKDGLTFFDKLKIIEMDYRTTYVYFFKILKTEWNIFKNDKFVYIVYLRRKHNSVALIFVA